VLAGKEGVAGRGVWGGGVVEGAGSGVGGAARLFPRRDGNLM
jgi:hypothetical protein